MRKAITIALFALIAGQAAAETVSGIEVYPSAKPDADVAKQLKQKMGINGKAYRTGDPVAKVADFYRKQKLEEMPGTSNTGAMFSMKGTNVTIQNPWMDMASGKINNDTLVTIVGKK